MLTSACQDFQRACGRWWMWEHRTRLPNPRLGRRSWIRGNHARGCHFIKHNTITSRQCKLFETLTYSTRRCMRLLLPVKKFGQGGINIVADTYTETMYGTRFVMLEIWSLN